MLIFAKLFQAIGITLLIFTFVDSFFFGRGYLQGEYFLFFVSIVTFLLGRYLEKRFHKNLKKENK